MTFPMTVKRRIEYIDITKGIAILVVCVGHILQNCQTDRYIYSFHMPLFFLLSGITFKVRLNENFITFFWRKFRSLMIPYYCFGFVAICVYYVMGCYAERTLNKTFGFGFCEMCCDLFYGTGGNDRLKFYVALWFLSCLFSIECISYFILSFKQSSDGKTRFPFKIIDFLFLFIAIGVVEFSTDSPFADSLPMGLNAAFRYLTFFLCGYLLQNRSLTDGNRQISDIVKSVLLILIGILCFFFCEHMRSRSLNFIAVLDNYPTSFISSFGYLFFCRFVIHAKFLSRLGRESLSILLLHKYPIVLVSVMWSWGARMILDNNLLFSLLLSFVAAEVSVLAGQFLKSFFPFLYGMSYRH